MCELCLPQLSRRRALGIAAAATTAALLGRPDPTGAARAFQTGYGVAIEPRATWAGDSRPFLGDPGDEDVKFLLVHHTAGPSEGDPLQLIRQVYDFHTGAGKGWPDVAYNFFVEPGGRVFEGRAGSLQRAVEASATGGNQGFAQLVCLLGDFTNRNPTDAQLRSLNETLAWLADRYALDTSRGATEVFTSRGSNRWPEGTEVTADTISGHREMSATACPGDTFFPYLKDRVQGEVHSLRGKAQAPEQESSTPVTGGPTPSTAAPRPSAEVTLPTTSSPPTTIPPSTVPATVANGPLISPPALRGDELAIDAADQAAAGRGRTSSNATTWVLGAAAASAIAAAAVYGSVRGGDPETRSDAEPSTPGGSQDHPR